MKTTIAAKVKIEIQRRNELFKGKTKAQKRGLIAQDVLDQIRKGVIFPESGTWVDFETYEISEKIDDSKFGMREAILSKEIRSCRCCALGGIVISCTLFKNKYTIDDFSDNICYELGDMVKNNDKFEKFRCENKLHELSY